MKLPIVFAATLLTGSVALSANDARAAFVLPIRGLSRQLHSEARRRAAAAPVTREAVRPRTPMNRLGPVDRIGRRFHHAAVAGIDRSG